MGETRGALDKNPGNVNLTAPQGYRFQIKKLPNVNYFLQTVDIPEITMPPSIQSNPFADIQWPGNKLTFGDLNITFKVDEDLNNYRELFNWMMGIGFPENTEEYGVLARKPAHSGEGVFSDASLIATTMLKNPNIEYIFQDAWPSYLGSIAFSTTSDDVNYLTCKATFKYTLFKVSLLP